MQTMHKNCRGFMKHEVMRAKEACRAQGLIESPSKADSKGMVRANMIQNCPITSTDMTNAHSIFGPDLASVRGKMVWHTPVPVVADYVEVPRSLVENNKVVMLAMDNFFVDGIAFLIMVSQQIKFITAEWLQVQMAMSLCKHIEWVLQVCCHAGFIVRTMY